MTVGFWVSVSGWVALEGGLMVRDLIAGVTDRGSDRGSGPFLIAFIAIAIVLDTLLSRDPSGGLRLRDGAIVDAGVACMWAGIALRLWAVLTLGRFFRLVVLVQDGHRVISNGPYRVLRHPAYTGTMVTLSGLGLALDSWLGLAACVVLPLIGYARRISVEETALRATLGAEYEEYARHTSRLVPLVW